jgi:hypothetical protein
MITRKTMKLLLLSDDGQVLDSTDEFTREEWDALNTQPIAAFAMLNELSAGR